MRLLPMLLSMTALPPLFRFFLAGIFPGGSRGHCSPQAGRSLRLYGSGISDQRFRIGKNI